jgi:O-antigen/teichoic acid export membrane protein
MILSKQVGINTVYRAGSLLFQFLNTVLISRLIGPGGFGNYSLMIVNANIVLTLTSLGIPAAVLYHASSNSLNLQQLMRIIMRSTLLQLILILAIEIIHYRLQGQFWTLPVAERAGGLVGVVFFLSIVISEKYYALFNGYRHFYLYNLLTLVFSAALTVALFFTYQWEPRQDAVHVITIFVLAQAAQTLVLILLFHGRSIGGRSTTNTAGDTLGSGRFINYSLYAFMANTLHFLVTRIDFWILDHFRGHEALGHYALASRIGQFFLVLPALYAAVVLPGLASTDISQPIFQRMFRLLNTTNAIAMLVLASIASWIIPWAFGDEFHGTVKPLIWLLPGIFALSSQTLIAAYFAGKDMPRVNMYAALVSLVMVTVLDFLLIPDHGATGAAVASSIAYSFGALYSFLRYCKLEDYQITGWLTSREDIFCLRNKLTKRTNHGGK